jgi:type I restriction enzyme S subunit
MGRGRKPKSDHSNLNWQEYFNKNVGVYLQSIIIELGHLKKCGNEQGSELLQAIKKQRTNKKEIKLTQIRPEEKPFRIPENWVWCRLGEIIEFTDNLNIEAVFSKDTLINYVDIDAIDNQNHKIRESKLKLVSELSSRARRVLRKGYIMYSLVRPYLNNIAIIEEEHPNHIGSTGFAVFNGIEVNNKYLKYILLSDYVRQLFLSMLSGFNSPTITQEQFNSTPIPLPPISEQNLILDFLTDLENKRIETSVTYFNERIEKKIVDLHNSQLLSSELFSELDNQLTQLENLNQAILQEAVQGKLVPQDMNDEPASELLKRIKAEKTKSGRKEKPLPPIKPEEIPFEIPENWVWCRLGELIEYTDNLDIQKHLTPETIINYVDIDAIDNQNFVIREAKQKTVSELSTRARRILKPNYIIYSTVRPYLKNIAIVKDEKDNYIGSTGFNVFKTLNVELKFVFYYLLTPYVNKSFKELMVGFNSPSITNEQFEKSLFPLPPLTVQKRIVAEIEKQLAKTKQLKEHIISNQHATEQLLKALVHQAFEATTI